MAHVQASLIAPLISWHVTDSSDTVCTGIIRVSVIANYNNGLSGTCSRSDACCCDAFFPGRSTRTVALHKTETQPQPAETSLPSGHSGRVQKRHCTHGPTSRARVDPMLNGAIPSAGDEDAHSLSVHLLGIRDGHGMLPEDLAPAGNGHSLLCRSRVMGTCRVSI
jgi:hypothetical protein